MKPWKLVGPLVLVALSLLPVPAHAQRRAPRPGGGGGGGGVSRAVPSRGIGSRVVVGAPFRSFSSPYYVFRPRVSVGYGLFVGYPVAYPYYGYGLGYSYGYPYSYYGSYGYGYPYPYPYASYATPTPYPYAYSGSTYPYPDFRPGANQSTYPYPNDLSLPPRAQGSIDPREQGSVELAPGSPQAPGTAQRGSGGISFDITPDNAQVYVEGRYVGLVSAFSPRSQPLTLAPGRHHVEIRLVGYQTMTFDTEVTAGQVVPYQGSMQR
jgi:PEGA domain